VINFSFLPFIWFFYVETARLSLEEIDRLFEIKFEGGSGMSYNEATRLACEELKLIREDHLNDLKEDPEVQTDHAEGKGEL
jgi:hypothetical protein